MTTMARFPRQPMNDRAQPPQWLAFVWEVNALRPGTFREPENQRDTPWRGYDTEKYPTARVIWGPGDEGIRIVADDDETAAAFREAAGQLGVHIPPPVYPRVNEAGVMVWACCELSMRPVCEHLQPPADQGTDAATG